MADEVIRILRSKYLISPIHYEGMVRKEPLEIPDAVLREAIYNAIVHKDYMGPAIQMKVWNDRIELWNDGPLLEGYTIETLLGDHSSKQRNKNIANAFYMAGFIETWGRGIDKIRNGLKDVHLPEPSFKEHCGGLLVTIPRSRVFSDLIKGDPQNDSQKLTKRQMALLKIVKDDIYITRKELSKKLKVSLPTIKREIASLRKQGVIVYAGSGKNGHWEVLISIR
jgi:ATP-dependent DNA helicase RecG